LGAFPLRKNFPRSWVKVFLNARGAPYPFSCDWGSTSAFVSFLVRPGRSGTSGEKNTEKDAKSVGPFIVMKRTAGTGVIWAFALVLLHSQGASREKTRHGGGGGGGKEEGERVRFLLSTSPMSALWAGCAGVST